MVNRLSLLEQVPGGSVRLTRCGRLTETPDKTDRREDPEDIIRGVDLPPPEALAGGLLVVVVVIMPPLAHGDEGEEPVVAAGVGGLVAARAPDVGKGVDGKGRVPKNDS